MIAVSQCPSSTSLVSSKSMSYDSFTTDALQTIHYATLPQRVHLNQPKSNNMLPNCQSYLLNEYPTKITSSLDQCNREQNPSPSSLDISPLHLNKEIEIVLPNISKDSAPLDLTCHRNNSSDVDSRAQITIGIDNPKTNLRTDEITDVNPDTSFPEIQAINYVAANESMGYNSNDEQIRRQKRRDQNKAAAQSYRQRKKSITELIETEHEIALRRNKQLTAYKTNLEAEILRMRSMLQDIAMSTKLKEEKNMISEIETPIVPLNCSNKKQEIMQNEALDYSRPTTQKGCSPINSTIRGQYLTCSDTIYNCSSPSTSDSQSISSAPVSPTYQQAAFGPSWDSSTKPFYFPPSLIGDEEQPGIRPRQNTWPMDKREIRIQGLMGKDRKKEQNRLASRRFRVRRKMEMSVNEVQLAVLDKRNVKLRRICDDYTKKIDVIKDVLEKLGCKMPSSLSLLLTDSSNLSSDNKVLQQSRNQVLV
jgi:hypothetical protein